MTNFYPGINFSTLIIVETDKKVNPAVHRPRPLRGVSLVIAWLISSAMSRSGAASRQ